MCFPSKKQKANFSEDTDKAAQKPQEIKAEAKQPLPDLPSTLPPLDSAKPFVVEDTPMAPKVGIIIYSMYGHIAKMAEAVKEGIESAGGSATIHQVAETLPTEILTKMHAPPKPSYPVIAPNDLVNFDAFILGVPTRYGNMPAQWKAFWDATGQLWASGALSGKYAGIFVSTAGHGGGQESTVIACMSTLAHHGILYVPFGYSHAFAEISNLQEVHGGSPWGAGTFAATDGSRQPSELELTIARKHGAAFQKTVARVNF